MGAQHPRGPVTDEQAPGVLGHGLEHGEALCSVAPGPHRHQRVLHQPAEQWQHVGVGELVGIRGDPLDGLEGGAASERTEQREESLLVLVEQSEAPVEGGPHGALPLRQVAGAVSGERLVEPVQQGRRWQQPELRRGQLDRQWQAGQPPAEFHARPQVGVRQRPGRGEQSAPLQHQCPGRGLPQLGHRPAPGRRQRERRDRHLLLATDPERGAAGDQHRETATGGDQPGDEHGRAEQVLDVVEDEQAALTVQVTEQGLEEPGTVGAAEPHAPRHQAGHGVGVADRCQRHQVAAVGVRRRQGVGYRCGEARLAHAPRSGQRHQPGPRLDEPDEVPHIVLAAEERGVGHHDPDRLGHGRRGGPGTPPPGHRGEQCGPFCVRGVEGRRQRPDGVRVGAGPRAPLERTDRMRCEAGTVGQLLLGESRPFPQLAQAYGERDGAVAPAGIRGHGGEHRGAGHLLSARCGDRFGPVPHWRARVNQDGEFCPQREAARVGYRGCEAAASSAGGIDPRRAATLSRSWLASRY
jgi:hypothetical protein